MHVTRVLPMELYPSHVHQQQSSWGPNSSPDFRTFLCHVLEFLLFHPLIYIYAAATCSPPKRIWGGRGWGGGYRLLRILVARMACRGVSGGGDLLTRLSPASTPAHIVQPAACAYRLALRRRREPRIRNVRGLVVSINDANNTRAFFCTHARIFEQEKKASGVFVVVLLRTHKHVFMDAGEYTLSWSNRHSLMTSKKLWLKG